MPMPPQLHSFFKKQYQYFIENSFLLYMEALDINGSLCNKNTCIVKKHNYEEAIKTLAGTTNAGGKPYNAYPINNEEHYIDQLDRSDKNALKNWTISCRDNNKPMWESIKFIYACYPEERKTILTHFNSLSDVRLNECFEDFFDLFCNNKKDILLLIKSFPKTSLGINTIDLHKLDSYLMKNGFTDNEVDHFFFSYFKNRESKLNLPENFAKARDFLLHKYDENKELLAKYFSFFPSLKDYFTTESLEDIKSAIFTSTTQSTIVDIDLNSCMKKILIDNYDTYSYRASVNFARRAIAKHFSAQESYSSEPSGTKNVERMVFLHNNPELTQQIVVESILNYLLYIKEQPDIIKNDNDTSAWLSHYLLNKKISEKYIANNSNNNKKKI